MMNHQLAIKISPIKFHFFIFILFYCGCCWRFFGCLLMYINSIQPLTSNSEYQTECVMVAIHYSHAA